MHLNRSEISANLFLHRKYTSKFMELQTIRAKFNSRYYELARTQNVRFNHKQPRQANYSIGNSSKSLISRMQKRSQVPTKQYMTETWVITYLQDYYTCHKVHHNATPPSPASVDSSNAHHTMDQCTSYQRV